MSSFMKLIPTKTQLLKLKKRTKFLEKGHDMLELKAESLLNQIKKFYILVRDRRKALMDEIVPMFQDLKRAEIISGEHALKALSLVNRELMEYNITINFKSSFGFTVPKLDYHIEKEKKFPHYGFSGTNSYLDRYYINMNRAIEELIKLAELENTIFILSDEYRKIHRRINALEDIIIPQTHSQIKQIDDILEENIIEEFIRLKKIKSKIEKKRQ
ncbi:MAG: V-type ATP synthase subunit D [Promethearchaeota archaeon]